MISKTEEDFRKEFLEVVKFFNEVVMSNPVVMDMRALQKYKKLIEEYTAVSESGGMFVSNNGKNIPMNKKNNFYEYIITKNDHIQNILSEYLGKLNFYYTKYKKNYDNITLVNVIMSTSLTFIEAMSLTLDQAKAFSIVSITISTGLAISTSYLKIKNYKEKLENIVKAQEKIHTCQAKLFTFDKKMKSHLCLSDTRVKNSLDIITDEGTDAISGTDNNIRSYAGSDDLSDGGFHEPVSHR